MVYIVMDAKIKNIGPFYICLATYYTIDCWISSSTSINNYSVHTFSIQGSKKLRTAAEDNRHEWCSYTVYIGIGKSGNNVWNRFIWNVSSR